jgi:hypothetical protein
MVKFTLIRATRANLQLASMFTGSSMYANRASSKKCTRGPTRISLVTPTGLEPVSKP